MGLVRRALSEFAGLLVPDMCVHCGVPSGEDEYGLCRGCRCAIPDLPSARCSCCGLPGLSADGHDALLSSGLCALCTDDPLRPQVLAYGQFSGSVLPSLLQRLKYRDEQHLVRPLAHLVWCAVEGTLYLRGVDVVVPVPLHDDRLVERGFNQSVLLATTLCRNSGLSLVHALKRVSRTRSQARLGRAERANNLKGSFELRRGFERRVEGKKILLIDDVVTTGWTVRECASILRAGGALGVDVICLGRTPRLR